MSRFFGLVSTVVSGVAFVAVPLVSPAASDASQSSHHRGWHRSYTAPYQPTAGPKGQALAGLFTDIVALSPSRVLAAGYAEADTISGPDRPIIEHWDGSGWSTWAHQPNPSGQQGYAIDQMAASSLSNVWLAVSPHTGNGSERLIRWDGRSWSTVTTKGLPTYWAGSLVVSRHRAWLMGIGGEDPNTVQFESGKAFVATYETSRAGHWRITKVAAHRGQVHAGSVAAPHNAWAVGERLTGGLHSARFHSLALHWNGDSWKRTDIAKAHVSVLHVAAGGGKSAMAIGRKAVFVHRANGWHRVSTPNDVRWLNAVTTDPHGGYWVAGQSKGHETQTVYYRYRAGEWTTFFGPVRSFADQPQQRNQVTAMSTAGNSVWAAGVHIPRDCFDVDGCPDQFAGAPIVDKRP